MRSFGHRVELLDMEASSSRDWQETQLSGFAKWMRLAMGVGFVLLALLFYVNLDNSLTHTPLGVSAMLLIVASGIYDMVRVLRARILWNDEGIRYIGPLREGRMRLWKDLSTVERNMHHRATVLTFGQIWKIRVYWGYGAQREITALAKQKLKENKQARKGWRKKARSETSEENRVDTLKAATAAFSSDKGQQATADDVRRPVLHEDAATDQTEPVTDENQKPVPPLGSSSDAAPEKDDKPNSPKLRAEPPLSRPT